MNNFLEASRLKLRFNTTQGVLSVEQLWDLSATKLATIIKGIKKNLNKDNDDELSFLDETKTVDKVQQLSFDVVKEIYLVKKDEADAAKVKMDAKAHNEKIMELIAKKKDESLTQKSVEELESLLIKN